MKHAVLKVSPILFIEMCKKGVDRTKVIANAIPKDSRFIRAYVDDTPGYSFIGLVIESESFKEVPYGNTLPSLPNPVFEKVIDK